MITIRNIAERQVLDELDIKTFSPEWLLEIFVLRSFADIHLIEFCSADRIIYIRQEWRVWDGSEEIYKDYTANYYFSNPGAETMNAMCAEPKLRRAIKRYVLDSGMPFSIDEPLLVAAVLGHIEP